MKTVSYTTYDTTDDIVASVISLIKTNMDAIADVASKSQYISAINDATWKLQDNLYTGAYGATLGGIATTTGDTSTTA